MKYDITAMACEKIFSYMLRSYYKKYLPEKDFMSVKKRLKKEYKQMVLRTPGIGGRKNSLSGNLTAACYLFALPKADPSVTPELFDDIIAKSIALPLFAKMHAKKKKEGAIFAEEKQNRRVAEAERSQNSPKIPLMKWIGSIHMSKAKMNFTVHTRNAAFASWQKEKIRNAFCLASVKPITLLMICWAPNCSAPKLWQTAMTAVIFML